MTDTVDLLIRARFDAVANSRDDRDWNDVLARARRSEFTAEQSAHRSGFLRRVPARVALVVAADDGRDAVAEAYVALPVETFDRGARLIH